MGSGSSRKKVNRQIQVPSSAKTPRRTPSPQFKSDLPQRPYSSYITKDTTRLLHSNSGLAHYAHIWESDGKLSSTFQQLIQTEAIKVQHEQTETKKTENISKHSSAYQTALVQSTLTSEVEATHTLATSEKLDVLMLNLKQTQFDFDEAVKRRIGQITNETESILSQIVEETQLSQQQLLIDAKEQQTIEDEQYRMLLESYVQQLDEKRARQLALIQEQLQEQRLTIFNQSEVKIRALNEQANNIKSRIMAEEERKAAEKIDIIVNEMNTISTEFALENIGTQIKTNINLAVIETVGSSNTLAQQEFSTVKQQHVKRTTYFEVNSQSQGSSTTYDQSNFQGKSIHKALQQHPVNQKIKS